MSNTKIFMAALVSIVASNSALAQTTEEQKQAAPEMKKEKCYGIVKAGKNDCASADGTHSCAGLAKNDGGAQDWVLLPAGTCQRVIGGQITPKANS